MRPLDPRLLSYAATARPALAGVVLAGAVQTVLIIVQAFAVTALVVRPIEHGWSWDAMRPALVAVAVIGLARAGVATAGDLLARLAADRITAQLRRSVLARQLVAGRAQTSARSRGELTALLTRGIDALEPYAVRYLPALVLSVFACPAVIVVIAVEDPWSAVIIALTLPLVPLFGAMVGWATQRTARRQWRTMALLAGHFEDATRGLATLVAFGRAEHQVEQIRTITRRHTRASLRTLRLAFTSSAVLELISSISVALVAVSVGLRLVNSELSLSVALVVLLLAPEAYLPLRRMGAEFHAAAEGVAAMEEVSAMLSAEPIAADASAGTFAADDQGPQPPGWLSRSTIGMDAVSVVHPGRSEPALAAFSTTFGPHRLHVVTGPSGCGKSTLLAVLLGLITPTGGAVSVDGVPTDPALMRADVAWVPQQPHQFTLTVRDSVRLAAAHASDAQILAALDEVGLRAVITARPDGLDTVLDADGSGLSAGEQCRLALARALLSGRSLLLVDEPTARLDAASEQIVIAALRRASATRTVIMVAHRAAVLDVADELHEVPDPARRAVYEPDEVPA